MRSKIEKMGTKIEFRVKPLDFSENRKTIRKYFLKISKNEKILHDLLVIIFRLTNDSSETSLLKMMILLTNFLYT